MRRIGTIGLIGVWLACGCDFAEPSGDTGGGTGTAGDESGSSQPPEVDLSGSWSLSQSCTDSCSPYTTEVTGALTVAQNGTAVTLTDASGNVYTGTLSNLELTFSLQEGHADVGGTQTVSGSGNYIISSDANTMMGTRLVGSTDVTGMTCNHTCTDTATR